MRWCILFLLPTVAAFSTDNCYRSQQPAWACEYMAAHNKSYHSYGEFKRRLPYIERAKNKLNMLKDTYEHRRRLSGINLRLGPYADRYDHERHTNKHLDLKKHRVRRRRALREKLKSAPTSFDWRNFGFETPIPVQGDCGGCFAFAATTVLEYWDQKWRGGSPRAISAQAAMDCSSRAAGGLNDGCEGGLMEDVFEYAEVHALPYDDEDPYIAEDTPCRTGSVHEFVSSFGTLSIDDDPRAEDHITWLVAHYGPVAVSVDSTSDAFQNYAGGIFSGSMCNKDIDHAMAIVGFTPNYWILKNSWGDSWGEKGYMRLQRGVNACGVAEYMAYVRSVHA